ncbi:hypothetical protein SO694_00017110 [Aureococcus anophagefferens]|uniref:Uncharacterized protein n=1 Tax=Aureococcus anophagefferens TaxID=44056 RepID=A0ABR1G1N5_AURAN
MGAGASSREAALSSPEKEPAKCRQPKLQSISFRRCDLHASSGGTYHHRGASEVAAGAASPLAADEAEAAGDDEDPAARLDRRAVEAWAADAVLLGAAGRSLTRLDLSEGCVSDRVAVGLADAARARPERVASLTDLDLSGGSSFAEGGCVGFRGCLALADVLPKALASLTALRVSGHHVGARGAAALAAALRKHPCLARLDAQRCFLGDAGVEALCGAGRSLVALDLSHNYFNRAGWRAIAALLETSTRLRSLALRDALADPAAGSLIQRECRPGGALTAADVVDAAVALAGGLAGNRALTRLDLGASFDREAALALGVDRRDARSVARSSSSPYADADLPRPLRPLADALAASRRRADDVKYGRREEAWNNVFFNEDDADDGADAKPGGRSGPRPTTSPRRARVEDAVDRYTDRRRASAVAEARDAQPTDYYGNGGYWRALASTAASARRARARAPPPRAAGPAAAVPAALRRRRPQGRRAPRGGAARSRPRHARGPRPVAPRRRDAGLASLAEALAAQARLASLDLSGNRLKGPGLAAACDALAAAPAARCPRARLATRRTSRDGAAAVGRLLASPRAAAAPALDLGGAARLRPKVADAALAPAALDRLGLDARPRRRGRRRPRPAAPADAAARGGREPARRGVRFRPR